MPIAAITQATAAPTTICVHLRSTKRVSPAARPAKGSGGASRPSPPTANDISDGSSVNDRMNETGTPMAMIKPMERTCSRGDVTSTTKPMSVVRLVQKQGTSSLASTPSTDARCS